MHRNLALTALAASLALAAGAASAQGTRPVLTLDTAKKMVEACEAKAKAEGWRMITAIMDDGGNLKLLSRMDGAFLGSIEIAQLKANTSASFPFSTRQLGDIATKYVPGIVHVPGLVTFAGGLPIKNSKGDHLGSIGVSGASADQDEQCAQVALDAVKDDLK